MNAMPSRLLPGRVAILALASLLSLAVCSCTGQQRLELVEEAKDAIALADPFMGDWQGSCVSADRTESPLAAQVIALGKGQYQVNLLTDFDKRIRPIAVLQGHLDSKVVHFASGTQWQGAIKNNKFSGSFRSDKSGTFVMKKVVRISPTMSAKPPAGAIVLFDGTNRDKWEHPTGKAVQWKLVDGAMEVFPRKDSADTSIVTKAKFKDFKLHLEFRTPFRPKARAQRRGNSGVYLQERYEVQILDSYGLKGRDNECGGIYKVAAPRVNMCAPPTQWQTYDITFYAPRFDSAGKKIKNARVTVLHNGVKIHDNTDVPKPTGKPTALSRDITQPGGIYLQDHGNAVQYRNIWLLEL